jgi:hypothetical protein
VDEDQMQALMRDAVAQGLKDVLADPAVVEAFWRSAITTLQVQAQQQTGKVLLGGLTTLLKKGLLYGGLLVVAYQLGGWTFVKSVWAALGGG